MPASPFQIARWRAEGTLCPRCRSARQHPPQRYCAPCLTACGTPPLDIAREHTQLVRRLMVWKGADPAKVERQSRIAAREVRLARKRQAERKRKARLAIAPAESKSPPRRRAVNPLAILKSAATPTPEERVAAGLPKRPGRYQPRAKRVPYRSERRYKPRYWTREP
jgi:hypothetical protein